MKLNYRFPLIDSFITKPIPNWNWKDKILYRFVVWMYKPILCKFGIHKKDDNEWNYERYSGEVKFYCYKCQKLLKTVPLDDLDIKIRNKILSRAKEFFRR